VVETSAALERLAEVAALERSPRARRMLVIVNPYATTMSDRVKSLVVYALQGRYDVHAVDTQAKGHAIELCREAAHEGYDVVVAFGGDGTVNEAANGLAGSPTPLTCLPGGATNVYCRMLGIPADVVDATEHLLGLADQWRERRVDLGRLGDRRFTFSAGMGLDASVVERVDRHPHLKARFGPWYFAQAAVRTFLERYVVRPPRLEVTVGGKTVRGVSAFVQNGDLYTYFQDRPIHVAGDSELDSGDFSGAVLTRASAVDLPTVMFRALSKRAEVARHRRVHPFSGVHEVIVRSVDGRPVPVQVDGDHISDEVEARFTVEPKALRIVS
jgi:diacylglycerol kinase family enzyme